MPRINRRARTIRPGNQISRAQVVELLIGPNGKTAFRPDGELTAEAAALSAWREIEPQLSPAFARRWHAWRTVDFPRKDFSAIADDYARGVVDGDIIACDTTKNACRRHLADLEKVDRDDYAYRFDRSKADRVCRFAEHMPHVKGKWAAEAELITLEPWQIFILCAIFGWVKKSTGTRRFSLAYLEVGRKNAKSILAAIIGLYMFACDGEFGAEVYSGATKEDQAMEVFRPALQMLYRTPELCRFLGVRISSPTSKEMRIPEDNSRFEVVVRKPGDGASPTCGIVDEYHEHESDTLFDTLRTGMGARQQPLELVITTAGFNLAGPCKLLQADVMKILAGSIEREEVFGIIYTIDAGDDWTSEIAIRKANPNYGVSIEPDFIKAEIAAAIKSPRKQSVVKTKYLCVWVGASAAYFDVQRWRALGDRELRPEAFVGSPCVVSVDLATKRDITARVVGFKKVVSGKDHFYFFTRFYIPGEQANKPEAPHLQMWSKEAGVLIVHPGETVDFELIQQETNEEVRRFRAREFAFDPWNAAQFAQGVGKDTKAVPVEIPQNTAHLSPPMKALDALIAEGRVHHDGNPVMEWMIGNVSAHEDANENVFPLKDDSENKIDGPVAAMMTLSRLMVAPVKKSVYSTRGILTVPMDGTVAMNA